MKVVVVGGRLQGIEATYLARQAGWEVVVVDKEGLVPASGLGDQFYRLDVTAAGGQLAGIVRGADLIIPAVEDEAVLDRVADIAGRLGVPMAHDGRAYSISSSKRRSDRLFEDHGIAAPAYWPRCNLPIVAKPSKGSGSRGVKKFDDHEGLFEFVQESSGELDKWVIQEFLDGPSYSLEIIGCAGEYVTLQTTDLDMDHQFDCKRVSAPTGLEKHLQSQFREIATIIAEALNLYGIMDVEVIKHENVLRVLEIDARLPSQTPTVVYKSTGINMLAVLSEVFLKGRLQPMPPPVWKTAVLFEHVSASPGGLEVQGEHIMAHAGPLRHVENFFGADEAITNFEPGRGSWVATLINTGSSRKDVWARRQDVISNICKHCRIPDHSS